MATADMYAQALLTQQPEAMKNRDQEFNPTSEDDKDNDDDRTMVNLLRSCQ